MFTSRATIPRCHRWNLVALALALACALSCKHGTSFEWIDVPTVQGPTALPASRTEKCLIVIIDKSGHASIAAATWNDFVAGKFSANRVSSPALEWVAAFVRRRSPVDPTEFVAAATKAKAADELWEPAADVDPPPPEPEDELEAPLAAPKPAPQAAPAEARPDPRQPRQIVWSDGPKPDRVAPLRWAIGEAVRKPNFPRHLPVLLVVAPQTRLDRYLVDLMHEFGGALVVKGTNGLALHPVAWDVRRRDSGENQDQSPWLEVDKGVATLYPECAQVRAAISSPMFKELLVRASALNGGRDPFVDIIVDHSTTFQSLIQATSDAIAAGANLIGVGFLPEADAKQRELRAAGCSTAQNKAAPR